MVTQYIVNFTDPETTAFTVNPFTTDGPVAPNTLELSSTAVRASTSLLLYGKGHPDYGERIAEDFIHLMENFSGATEPTYPISGQTWFARITYAFVGVGSPAAANVYRWEDDSSLTAGGRWVTLTNVGASDPTAADEVKTTGTTPATVVDGAFYLDTNGSPLVPELYIGVNNSSSNMTATWLKREVEDLTGLVGPGGQFTSEIGGSPNLKEYLPQKQLKVYDGVQWKNAGNVYTSHVPPQSPAIGDMWYQLGVPGSPPAGSPALGGGGGPLSQLFIWARPGPGKAPRWLSTGYVDRTGDTMTGPLYFGLPTPSLALWEGGGSDTAGADIRATGNALLTSQEGFYIHIDYDASDANAGNVVFEIASNSQTRTAGTFNRLFQVRSDGIIRSALPWGSPAGPLGSPNTYKALLATADDNALINKAYVDDVIATVTTLETRVTNNEANIISLAGSPIPGSPKTPVYNGKVDRIGDTMTGTLVFSFGSPQLGTAGISMGDTLIQNLQTPQSPEDAATKQYVDDQISASGSVDKFIDSGSYDQITGTLTLTKNFGSPVTILNVVPIVTSSDVRHTIDDFSTSTNNRFLRDTFQEEKFGSPLFGSPLVNYPLFATQEEINTTGLEAMNERLATLELPLAREIIHVGIGSPRVVGGSPVINTTRFSFTNDNFVAGTHRLMVFVNGVKQYVNERGHQRIQFNTSDNLSISGSAKTFLDDDSSTTYKMQIAVDGGAAQELSATGNALLIFQDIVDEINAQITGVTAVWNFPKVAIDVYSNTTGTNSQINITDGIGSPSVGAGSPNTDYLLSALATIPRRGQGSPLPGSGSPLANTGVSYTIGSISPTSTAVLQDLAYYEASSGTGSPLIDATFGEISSNIVFNSQLQAADTIELLYEPVKE